MHIQSLWVRGFGVGPKNLQVLKWFWCHPSGDQTLRIVATPAYFLRASLKFKSDCACYKNI